MNILIGGAWLYVNGSLHIGHIASLLPGDVLARYYRSKGDSVYYVSGSDCHGTPVTIRARQEGSTPEEISGRYHEEFCAVFSKLGFSYDHYGRTSAEEHKLFVQAFHSRLYESGLIYEKTAPQAYCPGCGKTLTDRLVTGKCPVCGGAARGDQCDACVTVLEAELVKEPRCVQCGGDVELRESKQLYIALSKLGRELKRYLGSHPEWRRNAIAFTKRYIDEGLRDRAITRDLEWGIDVPKEGYEQKKIYIWAENVLGYLSGSSAAAAERGACFEDIWGENARHYYVHGKDNIPFHTIILPALLLAHGGGLRLPDDIISSEYVTLEGRKISTSGNWAVWAKDITDKCNPDAVRYFFIANGPERRDTDFSWREFAERNNGELVGVYGNFVNRTLAFIVKYNGGVLWGGELDAETKFNIEQAYETAGEYIEQGRFKDALECIFELVRYGNRYYDEQQPWKTRTEAPGRCDNTLYVCVQIICNLAVLFHPFLPFSSEKLFSWLGVKAVWKPHHVNAGYVIPETSILFERIEKSITEHEINNIGSGTQAYCVV